MIKLTTILVSFAILSTFYSTISADVHGYNITVVTTSNKEKKFDSYTGKFKLELRGKDTSGKNFSHYLVLNPEGHEIKFNHSYSYPAASQYPLDQISTIFLRWTLKSPFNPIYLVNKPKIYFDRVSITANQLERGINTVATKIFCSKRRKAVGIKHDEGEVLETCLPIPLYPVPGVNI